MDTLAGESNSIVTEVDLEAKGVGMKWSRALNLYKVIVRKSLPPALATAGAGKKDTAVWSHLRGIELPTISGGPVSVELLIGLDTPQALEPLEVRSGGDGHPFAVRTRLGWTINGPIGYPRLRTVTGCNTGHAVARQDSQLEVQVKRFWELETEAERAKHYEALAPSIEDKRVLQMWDTHIRVVNGHYQLPIPFRREPPNLPNNRIMAEGRLRGLRRRLLRNPTLHERYRTEIQLLLDRGYVEHMSEMEAKSNPAYTWYLPHHPVPNPKKPDKLRIVFDCAAVHESISLNSQILQGPDLTNKLLGVLLRFRQGSVAVMADIEAMFHQIKVPSRHRDALRFLWWKNGDLSQHPSTYRMTVHLFGGVWSPSCATFALQRALLDHKDEFREASEKAARNFYVDDLLLSMDSPTDATVVSRQLRTLLADKGFRLTKWISNHKRVLASIPPSETHPEVKEIDLTQKALPKERALGIQWDVHNDLLAVYVDPQDKPTTKRGVLSMVSSIYDPLGFVSPYIIRAKMIFQDECRRNKGWDETLTDCNRRAWEEWYSELTKLIDVQIPRQYVPVKTTQTSSIQLHHFCDASQKAYGTVSYLRVVDDRGIHCSFVFGKAKLAPLKQQTIPRLELCAAVLAVKMDQYLRNELDIQLLTSVFWTDSTLVLQYIRNTETRFRTFVANRVTVIRELSNPTQWRHIHTTLNPADDATRGLSAQDMIGKSKWIKGPPFLRWEETNWPEGATVNHDPKTDPEVVSCSTLTSSANRDSNGVIRTLWKHYSSWYRLVKGVAWLRRFIHWLQNKRQHKATSSVLEIHELRGAKKAILKQAQREKYPDDIDCLSKGRRVARSSNIYKLEPWLDGDGLLRVGGRLTLAPIATSSKGPILLSRDHPVTELVTRDVHQNLAGHSGREHTLALLRQEYWVPQFRRRLDKMLKNCVVCRRNNWKPTHQREAPLPLDRVSPGGSPFTSTGVDCFGPFLVKHGRRQFKRWGCIFTCASTRAIHLEVLSSLDAAAFLNGLTRFASRRGTPTHIRSDNGTNMVGAHKELRVAMHDWKEDARVRDTLLQRHIQWTFNPPKASHMGGVWERQIRTVKKVLRAIVGTQVLDDERLHTLLCETEAVINSRPLTPASEDPSDLEALTPNHLLRVGSHACLPLGGPMSEDQYRRRWKHVQFLADQFWKRWQREYLPLLRQRSGLQENRRNFNMGDLVIVADETVPRNQWKLGRVTHVQPGDDGLVRQVRLRTASKVLLRPVNKLCFLEGLNG